MEYQIYFAITLTITFEIQANFKNIQIWIWVRSIKAGKKCMDLYDRYFMIYLNILYHFDNKYDK